MTQGTKIPHYNVSGHTLDWWLGGSDLEQEGTFRWVNGESVVFNNWYKLYPIQPDANDVNADCIVAQPDSNYRGTWFDRGCSSSQNFICERTSWSKCIKYTSLSCHVFCLYQLEFIPFNPTNQMLKK